MDLVQGDWDKDWGKLYRTRPAPARRFDPESDQPLASPPGVSAADLRSRHTAVAHGTPS